MLAPSLGYRRAFSLEPRHIRVLHDVLWQPIVHSDETEIGASDVCQVLRPAMDANASEAQSAGTGLANPGESVYVRIDAASLTSQYTAS